jgi:DNA repair ATPase RecN
MVIGMTRRLLIFSCLFLSGVAGAATTAPVPTLTITRHAERRATPPNWGALEAASREVSQALSQFRRTANECRQAFEASPEYSAAVLAMMDSRTKLDVARREVVAQIRSTPEYVQQSIRVEKLESQLATLRRDGKNAELLVAAHQLLSERAALSKLEASGMEQNPAIADLRQQYIDAAAQVTALRENFAQDLRRNADWQQAKANYEDAVRRRASSH